MCNEHIRKAWSQKGFKGGVGANFLTFHFPSSMKPGSEEMKGEGQESSIVSCRGLNSLEHLCLVSEPEHGETGDTHLHPP